jgi:hypothetical protein
MVRPMRIWIRPDVMTRRELPRITGARFPNPFSSVASEPRRIAYVVLHEAGLMKRDALRNGGPSFPMRYSVFGAALAGAIVLFALQPGYAEQSPAGETPAAPVATPAAATPQVVSAYPQSRLKPFDMKECYEDRGCQLATCVSQLTAVGPIVICQSHGTTFP